MRMSFKWIEFRNLKEAYMIVVIALIMVVILSGILANIPKESRFLLPQALLFTVVQTVFGILFFVLNMWLLSESGLIFVLMNGLNSFFLIILLVAFIDGLLLYGVKRIVFKYITLDSKLLTLSEYIIQWSLIYITVYQVMYDNIFPNVSVALLRKFSVSHPSELMIGILPSLISVWVALIFYKIKNKLIQ